MPQSLSKVYLHSIWSTKYRKQLILPAVEDALYAYMGGIIRGLGCSAIAIGGMPDHVHVLSTFSRTMAIAKFIEEIKRNSSKWIKTQGEEFAQFKWQGGYATFSVSQSGVENVTRYIKNQKEHHKEKAQKKILFKEELIAFLEAHDVEYDEKYLWD